MSTPPLEYELNEPLDGSSWAVRENLAEILQREIHGPLYGDNEVLSVSPDVAYVVGRIAPKRIQRSTDDPHTEAAWFPADRTLVVINNSEEPRTTRIKTTDGAVTVSLDALETKIMPLR